MTWHDIDNKQVIVLHAEWFWVHFLNVGKLQKWKYMSYMLGFFRVLSMSMSYIMIWQQENALISLNNFYCFNLYGSLAEKLYNMMSTISRSLNIIKYSC